jgi:hypothetical protein
MRPSFTNKLRIDVLTVAPPVFVQLMGCASLDLDRLDLPRLLKLFSHLAAAVALGSNASFVKVLVEQSVV